MQMNWTNTLVIILVESNPHPKHIDFCNSLLNSIVKHSFHGIELLNYQLQCNTISVLNKSRHNYDILNANLWIVMEIGLTIQLWIALSRIFYLLRPYFKTFSLKKETKGAFVSSKFVLNNIRSLSLITNTIQRIKEKNGNISVQCFPIFSL